MQLAVNAKVADIDVGLAAVATLPGLLRQTVSDLQAFEFREECASMLVAIVTKIKERSPYKYHFTRKLVSMDPRQMVEKPDDAVKMFKLQLAKLVDAKWRTATQADDILGQYRKFISDTKQFHHEKCAGFRVGED